MPRSSSSLIAFSARRRYGPRGFSHPRWASGWSAAWGSALLAGLVALPIGAQEFVEAKIDADRDFAERYDPQVNVAGHVIVGVMVASARLGLSSAGVTLPPSAYASADEVCLRVSSQDGVYSTTARYALPPLARAQPALLPYPSKLPDVVAGFAPDAIAIAATSGPCGKPSREYIVVGATGEAAADPIHVYVNGMDANDVFARIQTPAGWSEPRACKKVKAAQQRAYDFLCVISAPAAGPSRKVEVLRERWGRAQPTVVFEVAGGGR